jgi:endonuclease/exonuclease/phosphatase family metal-dependent hydrolase
LNTLWIEDEREERQNLAGKLLKQAKAEIALLQEIPARDLDGSLRRISQSSGLEVLAVGVGSGESATAILSNLEGEGEEPVIYTGSEYRFANAVGIVRVNGLVLRVCSAHQPWGGLAENERVQAAIRLNEELSQRGTVDGCVLGGDFNALEDTESIRYLTGVQTVGGRTAQWTDAWHVAGEGDGITSSPDNPWAISVGVRHGFLEPDLLPERRIDYIFVQGYAHGNLLSPLQAEVLKRVEGTAFYPSDHWAVGAKLYLPRPVQGGDPLNP